MIEKRTTTCNRDCPDACRIVATWEDGKVVQLEGDRDHAITRGFLCYRTSHFLRLQYGSERLTRPLLRINGDLREVSWEHALDFLAERLVAIRAESGPAAIFHYRSGGSLGLLTHLTDYFFERFGPVTVKRGDICSGAGDAAQVTDFGIEDSNDIHDLLNARNIILWGKNVSVSSPHLLPILKEAKGRGASVVQIDPVRHRSAGLYDRFIQPRPGGDFALAMAVANILIDRGWVDPAAQTYCDNLREFGDLAQSHTAHDWCRRADVDFSTAEDLARRLGPGRPTAILVGWGLGRRLGGGVTIRALDALGAISGNLGVPGGGVSFYYKRRGAFDLSFIKGLQAAPRSICEPLFGHEVMSAENPPIRALWITAGNPAVMLPDAGRVAEAIRSRELSVVVDPFFTDTAKLATCVLPTTTLLEADDIVGAYGHHMIGEARPVVAPPPGVKSDLEIMQAMAERVGLGDVMSGDAREWKKRLIAPTLGRVGITLEEVAEGSVRNPASPKVLFADRRFATTNGRVNLVVRADVPDAVVNGAAEPSGYPLQLMALSTERSQSSQWSRKPEGLPEISVHPDSAAGVSDGGTARLVSRLGALVVRVKHDPNQRRDLAIGAKGGHQQDGHCLNLLIAAQTTDIGEGGALYDEPVRLDPFPPPV